MRVAFYYGLWATICFVLTSVIVFALTETSTQQMLGLLKESRPLVLAVFLAASLGWATLHRRDRRVGPAGYCLLAIGVALIVHFIFVAMMLFIDAPSAARLYDVGNFLGAALIGLVLHGWFTIPIALGATGLFVWWLRCRAPERA